MAQGVLTFFSTYPETDIDPAEILHPEYFGGTGKSIPNTWNELWETGIEELIDYSPGIDALISRMEIYNSYMGNREYEVLEAFLSTDKVILRCLLSFDYNRPIMGYPANGQRIEIESFETFRFRDQLIDNWKVDIDFYRWLKSIGASLSKEGDSTRINRYIQSLKEQNILPA
jgi:hypothetical protein